MAISLSLDARLWKRFLTKSSCSEKGNPAEGCALTLQFTSLLVFLVADVESKMRKRTGLACALLFSTLYASAVEAQSQGQAQCGPREEVAKVLNAKFQESQRAIGLINEKAVMEVYISPKGTWTMVVTNEAGMSCVLAAGEAWDEKPTPVAGPFS
jgi:hypothetical protein